MQFSILSVALVTAFLALFAQAANENWQAEIDKCNIKSKDYCALCADHTACKPTVTLKDNTVFTQEHIDIFVASTNKLRNEVASGATKLPKAAGMASVKWDCELAIVAGYHVARRVFAHDTCRKTDRWPMAVQCLALSGHSRKFDDTITAIHKANQLWFDEIKKTTLTDLVKFPSGQHFMDIGHFLAMMKEDVTAFGCAALDYIDGMHFTITACHYSRGYISGEPTYKFAEKKAGERCKTGTHPVYTSLCGPDEVY